MARRVLIAEVSGGRVAGRPRLGRMDGVQVALGNRGTTAVGCTSLRERLERVESPGRYVTESVSCSHFFFALSTFGPGSRALMVMTWRGEGCCYMMRLGETVKRRNYCISWLRCQVYGIRGVC